ncbi:TPA: hypothetical protein N0F65_012133 [Lagenidium giganteum]|uniref:Leucine-rich repeat domain, L domain-like n=1 Tax=Lagenidium giganteum TaxID=4803 RepID=A0AAV2YK53_9STRA|nr:TPA: hypothetical protein N0F65_012133 [Lagenidium giganteum]
MVASGDVRPAAELAKAPVPSPVSGNQLVVELSAMRYALLWTMLALFHVLSALYYAGVAKVYVFFMPLDQHYILDNLVIISRNRFGLVAVMFALISALNCYELLRMLRATYSQHRVAFFTSSVAKVNTERATRRTARALLWTGWVQLFGRRGMFGVEGPLFHVMFMVREVIEIIIQTYQAYRMSFYVADPSLNRLSVGVVVINCFSTALLHHVYKKSPSVERFAVIGIDVVLDIVSAMVIPLVVFMPYYVAFSSATQGFSDDLIYDDVWPTKAVKENEMLFVVSQSDLFAKTMPALSLLVSVRNIKMLVRRQSHGRHSEKRSDRGLEHPNGLTPLVRNDTWPTPRPDYKQESHNVIVTSSTKKQAISSIVHAFIMAWGLAIACFHLQAMHLAAQQASSDVNCLLPIQPWFTSKPSCAILEINCHRLNVEGNENEIGHVLQQVDEVTLLSLIIEHCPVLKIPERIQSFRYLKMLEVYNCTVAEWSEYASLTNAHHPLLGMLYLVRVNWTTGLPPGLLSHDFPQLLIDVEISKSNLTSLPDAVVDAWAGLELVVIEHSDVHEYPPQVVALKPPCLAMTDNGFTSIPSLSSDQPSSTINLSVNPISALPPSLGDLSELRDLWIAYTNISDFPPELLQNFVDAQIFVYAAYSPLCDAFNAKAFANDTLLGQLNLNCDPSWTPDTLNWFPLASHSARRPLNGNDD